MHVRVNILVSLKGRFNMNTVIIVIIAGASALLLIGLIILLYKTIFSRGVIKRQAKEISSTFETEHAILFGEIKNYIDRLKAISNMNITYIDTYKQWQVRFNDVRDSADSNAQSNVNGLNDAIQARHWNEAKEFIPKVKKSMDEYKRDVEELRNDLKNIFKIEDEVNALSLNKKEEYRAVKNKFYTQQNDLTVVSESMSKVFKNIDNSLEEAENLIENAHYQEAKDIYLNKVDTLVKKVDLLLNVLPSICTELTSVLPDKLLSLKNRYNTLIAQGYPLNHILSRAGIETMDKNIKEMLMNVKVLNNNGISKSIDELHKCIETYNEKFDKEEEARKDFEARHEQINREENVVHQKYVNLTNNLPAIKGFYLLGGDDTIKINEMGKSVSNVSSAKTLLDNYVHSASRQLYTVLVAKMNDLDAMVKKAKAEIESFEAYLQSLKSGAEQAATLIKEQYTKAKEYESQLYSLNVDKLITDYSPRFANIYQIIDSIYEELSKRPINVAKVNEEVAKLKTDSMSLYGELSTKKDDLNNAELSIVHANRYRIEDAANDQLVSQAENMFRNGFYKEAYNVAKDIKGNETIGQ